MHYPLSENWAGMEATLCNAPLPDEVPEVEEAAGNRQTEVHGSRETVETWQGKLCTCNVCWSGYDGRILPVALARGLKLKVQNKKGLTSNFVEERPNEAVNGHDNSGNEWLVKRM